jgi:predicted nucleic-acid-binding protein
VIAVDTNVLLRYLLDDDAGQAEQARRLFTGDESVLITDVVLVEAVWTLRGRKYRLGKPDILRVLHALFEEINIRFENSQVVWQALHNYRNAKPAQGGEADFADALIVGKARHVVEALPERFNGLYTFDKAAQALPDTKAPA